MLIPSAPRSLPLFMPPSPIGIDRIESPATKETPPKSDGDGQYSAPWWSFLRWIGDSLVLPCKPTLLPLLFWNGNTGRTPVASSITATILCPDDASVDNNNNSSSKKKKKITLCFQEGGTAAPPFLLLDLPIDAHVLSDACRVTLECDRAVAGGGPLLDASTWMVYCNGRRVGFGTRREVNDAEAWVLEAIGAVSAGAGLLPGRTTDGKRSRSGFKYFRWGFDRVVGSDDSEAYHLLDPIGWLDHELSFFFIRV